MADRRCLIEVQDLVKSYGSVRALDGVSFSVEEGEVLGFLGPNGAGKTTTLRILAGFLPGDAGTVRVAGHDAGAESLAVRRSIGYLPEGVPLYPEMRVDEYLRFRARIKGVSRRDRRRLIDESLQATQIRDVRRRIIGTLSRGYRQRVGLADALLGEPKVLILDEPTVGLDPEQVRQFRGLLSEVGRDRTVILSTHILSEVELVCSSVIIISRGRIVARDSAEKLRAGSGGRVGVVAEIAGPPKQVERAIRAIEGVSRVDRTGADDGTSPDGAGYHCYRVIAQDGMRPREQVFLAAARNGWTLRRLEQEVLPLEEVFMDLVGRRP